MLRAASPPSYWATRVSNELTGHYQRRAETRLAVLLSVHCTAARIKLSGGLQSQFSLDFFAVRFYRTRGEVKVPGDLEAVALRPTNRKTSTRGLKGSPLRLLFDAAFTDRLAEQAIGGFFA